MIPDSPPTDRAPLMVTRHEAMRLLGVKSRDTLRKLERAGLVQAVALPGCMVRISYPSLERLLTLEKANAA